MASAMRVFGTCFALALAVNVCQGAVRGEEQGYLGVQIKALASGDGIQIIGLEGGEAGDKGGLKENDILIKANGNKVGTVQEFVDTVRKTKPGETIELTILRGATEMELKIKVGKKPASQS
jgi:S1-C subfamily serine protease